MESVEQARQAFARTLGEQVPPGPPRERIVAAFAAVPREGYLGPGPWRVATTGFKSDATVRDPARLYQDAPVAIDRARGINNGQPSLHARCLAALAIQPGERVDHIGAGTGYYTAILAQLTGPPGRVEAYEIEADLARRAAANLAEYPQVHVHAESGATAALPRCEVVYVNAGASAPLRPWLEAIEPGGRLLFPLTGSSGAGAMLLVRRGAGEPPWPAQFLDPVIFMPCSGGCGAESAGPLAAAFARGGAGAVRSLHWGTPPAGAAPPTVWHAGEGWWLSTSNCNSGPRRSMGK